MEVNGLGGDQKPQELVFQPSLNVIFGDNGSGKSTLLRTIVSALRNDVGLITDSPISAAEVTFTSFDYEALLTRTLVKQSVSQPDERQLTLLGVKASDLVQKSTWSWMSEGKDAGKQDSFACGFLPVSRLYLGALVSPYRRSLQADPEKIYESSLEAMFVTQFNQKWSLYSNELLAEVQQIQQEGIASILQTVMFHRQGHDTVPQGDPAAAYRLARSFFQRQPELRSLMQKEHEFINLYQGNPALRAVIRNIESVETKIAEVQRRRTFLNESLNDLFRNKTVLLGDSGMSVVDRWGQTLALEKLSTGEKQLLVMFVEILSDGDNVLVIDEPEISLHIAWQRRLLRTLHELNPKAQIIVATHSPEIMADIDDDCIYKL